MSGIDGLQVHAITAPPGAVVEPPVPEWAVSLILQTAPFIRVGFNRPPRWLAVWPGALLIAPPDTSGEYVAEIPTRVVNLAIPKAHVEEFALAVRRKIEVRREEAFGDLRLARQIMRLWRHQASNAPGGGLLADEVLREVLTTLAQRAERPAPRDAVERLPTHLLRRVRDYIESGLADDLTVADIAAVAGLSTAHFARAFTATAGMSPYRYVMMRRLVHARELLEHTDRSTIEIALDTGFKSASHFASRFRREFGITPREVRQ